MRIGADNDLTGGNKAAVGQKRVLDTHASYFKIIGDLMLACKVAQTFAHHGRFDILARRKMVRY